ncbi:hypothetical protein [Corynebacterium uterequi]|uniref:DUF1542 domain-containing protein n=1 Tax=Corynebacterium uterequi TaxID=1072256 RepID=A0A0G3HG16_9CORY|nr:hypothetical protein [Corynebacterium uterequi]AKK11670.1 hypothetical protein CUTER_08435 [Corynebacterium uterequi]
MGALLLILVVVVAAVVVAVGVSQSNKKKAAVLEQQRAHDAQVDAERWTQRLGSQVLSISGTDVASTQAMADASERFTAANGALSTARTTKEFLAARESALEGLHYVNAAREIMGMPAGPALPELEGQRRAGKVTEQRTIEHDGQTITASPHATNAAPHYYPGGTVAGRPVPAGWYSSPWWADALSTGLWSVTSMMLFSSMFSGMSGVPSAEAFEAGYAEGLADAGQDADAVDAADTDSGDAGDAGDAGMDSGDGDGGGFFDGLFGGDGGDGGGFDFDFDF